MREQIIGLHRATLINIFHYPIAKVGTWKSLQPFRV